jgi:hypothetical protein
MTYPRTFSHIGLSVTNLEQAVDFYTKVFGWYVIMPPTEIVADDSAIGVMCNDVFGEGWAVFVSPICPQVTRSVLKSSNLKTPKSGKTILNTGKPASSTFAFKIRTSRG